MKNKFSLKLQASRRPEKLSQILLRTISLLTLRTRIIYASDVGCAHCGVIMNSVWPITELF